jgi:hypothetical protein
MQEVYMEMALVQAREYVLRKSMAYKGFEQVRNMMYRNLVHDVMENGEQYGSFPWRSGIWNNLGICTVKVGT